MATRADVAKRAGVSPSTVSYVLNGQRPTTDETKAEFTKQFQISDMFPTNGPGTSLPDHYGQSAFTSP